ncbi:PaaI family thioesterase [Sphingopyxis indica]|uniref:PaaI family thioesterase n=1 Tax=Sphingopyxis indica TaxID=436663 RepID=UPI002938F13E|nr:PaaI family thioesterase [Sphingopyxis indica]WOF43211.1 PaaI family thioesterase [Sphingopyxis indica]
MRGHRFASNEDAVAYMKRVAVDASGFTAFLGVEPLRCFAGESELLLTLRPDMTQHHGFAHGAIVGLMADNACAWAASSVVGDVVTGSYTINFLAPAQGQRLRAKGVVIKAGKRQAIVRADVWAERDGETPRHCATAQATIMPVAVEAPAVPHDTNICLICAALEAAHVADAA